MNEKAIDKINEAIKYQACDSLSIDALTLRLLREALALLKQKPEGEEFTDTIGHLEKRLKLIRLNRNKLFDENIKQAADLKAKDEEIEQLEEANEKKRKRVAEGIILLDKCLKRIVQLEKENR